MFVRLAFIINGYELRLVGSESGLCREISCT